MSIDTDSRRNFLKKVTLAGAAVVAGSAGAFGKTGNNVVYEKLYRPPVKDKIDKIRLALIGAGGMGTTDAHTALRNPGTEIVAVADLYTGRLERAKKEFGKDIQTTRDYREILLRDDIDAVIVATQDNWHKRIAVDVMKSGKHVYLEKPMVHSIDEGPEVIKTQQETGKVLQVGSQLLSSLGYEKAKELINDGAIGDVNYAEGVWTRRSPEGAWNGPIPKDASTETVDWNTFLKYTTKREWNPDRFFNWRKYVDYGTGMNGDLYVHIISGLHFVLDSYGPNKIYSSGGIRFWKDGREVPDVLIGTFDYPDTEQHPGFNLSLRCNFVDGTNGPYYYVMRINGSEGELEVKPNEVKLFRNKVTSAEDPNLYHGNDKKAKKNRKKILGNEEVVFKADKSYKGCHYDHFAYWLAGIREGSPIVEDAVFGYRAAAPALLCNESYFKKSAIQWDPVNMKIV